MAFTREIVEWKEGGGNENVLIGSGQDAWF